MDATAVQCPVCGQDVDVADTAVVTVCPRCETPHHRDCWDYTGGCAIFGCKRVPARRAAAPVRLPAVLDFEVAARRWIWLYRVDGWGKVASLVVLTTLVGAAASSAVLHMVLPASLASSLSALCALAAVLAVCSVYPLLVFFAVLHVLLWWYERTVRAFVGERLAGRHEPPSRDVVDRMDTPAVDAAILRVTRDLDRLAVVGTIITGVYAVLTNFFVLMPPDDGLSMLLTVCMILFAFVLLPSARSDFEARVGYLTTIQNRLIATLKQKR